MPKSFGQKMRILALKEIFERETDTEHGITMACILEMLAARGIITERKAIYDDINTFRGSGYLDIVGPREQSVNMLLWTACLKYPN